MITIHRCSPSPVTRPASFFDSWRKYRAGETLSGLEAVALQVILLRPEYHALLECLAETIWQAQRSGMPPDEKIYLEPRSRSAARRAWENPGSCCCRPGRGMPCMFSISPCPQPGRPQARHRSRTSPHSTQSTTVCSSLNSSEVLSLPQRGQPRPPC